MRVDETKQQAMTDKQLQQIRERVKRATPGPWEQPARNVGDMVYRLVDHSPEGLIASCEHVSDAAFIAAARDDIPALLAEAERLRAQNAAMREVVQTVAAMEARQSEGWQQVGLFHESVNVLHVREQARAILAAESEGSANGD